jgi:hypothetical protein
MTPLERVAGKRVVLSVSGGKDSAAGAPTRCHSFVTDGNIAYCPDCTHALAGKTVPLPPWDDR